MTDLLPHIMLITGTFILAGLVKGVTGLGLPTVSMGLLGLAMSPVQAAALLLVPSLVTNLWQLFTGPRFGALLRRLWGMMLGVVVGTLAGSGLIAGTAGHATTAALGGALALYGGVGLRKPRLRVPAAAEPWAGPLAGVVTGLVTGATASSLSLPSLFSARSRWNETTSFRRSACPSPFPHWRSPLALPGTAHCTWEPRVPRCLRSCRRSPAWCWAVGSAHGCGPRPSDLASSPACWCWGANSCCGD